jgi:CRP-like cAMP-binding protein
MSIPTMLDTLRTLEFVKNLEPENLKKLTLIATETYFPPDEAIFREGDIGNEVHLIVSGQVAIEIRVPSRGQIRILALHPGALVGWSPLFPGKPYTATGRAIMPTTTLSINAADLRTLCQTDHELGCKLAWKIIEAVSDRLQATRLQLLDLFAPPL